MIAHRTVAATTFAVSLLFGASALAQQANTLPLKIGVLADFASVYADIGGQGNVEAAKIAIEEFGGKMFDKPIELVTADALNKADVAATITRKWYEAENVDMIVDMPTSAARAMSRRPRSPSRNSAARCSTSQSSWSPRMR
jgi:branched-chain amino acid transport system substrate-binding protein